jgi:hypothetical protein
LNVSLTTNSITKGNIFNIIQSSPRDKFYISSKGSNGILRRKNERKINMNKRLEFLFQQNKSRENTSKSMPDRLVKVDEPLLSQAINN